MSPKAEVMLDDQQLAQGAGRTTPWQNRPLCPHDLVRLSPARWDDGDDALRIWWCNNCGRCYTTELEQLARVDSDELYDIDMNWYDSPRQALFGEATDPSDVEVEAWVTAAIGEAPNYWGRTYTGYDNATPVPPTASTPDSPDIVYSDIHESLANRGYDPYAHDLVLQSGVNYRPIDDSYRWERCMVFVDVETGHNYNYMTSLNGGTWQTFIRIYIEALETCAAMRDSSRRVRPVMEVPF